MGRTVSVSNVTLMGVAPEASLFAVQVFSKVNGECGGGYDRSYLGLHKEESSV